MRAILKDDRILRLSLDKGKEIGPIPKKVGLERLRFDGKQTVDLVDLTQFHVEYDQGEFILHAVEIPGRTTPITMTYADRKILVHENGIPRLKTPTEQTAEVEMTEVIKSISVLKYRIPIEKVLIAIYWLYAYTLNPTAENRAKLEEIYAKFEQLKSLIISVQNKT